MGKYRCQRRQNFKGLIGNISPINRDLNTRDGNISVTITVNGRHMKLKGENLFSEDQWIEDWKISDDCYETSRSLVEVFRDFLTFLKEEKKLGKKALKKHETSCHALGGYIINDLYDSYTPSGDELKFGEELLLAYDIRYEAPLIHHDRESWQNAVDATCRQLYKFLNR